MAECWWRQYHGHAHLSGYGTREPPPLRLPYGVGSNPHNQLFYWNAESRLDSVSYDGYITVRYEYNALGQPVRKYRNGVLDRVWLWDGASWLAEFDAANRRVSEYQYGGMDSPTGSVIGYYAPFSIRCPEQDALGNVMATYEGTSRALPAVSRSRRR